MTKKKMITLVAGRLCTAEGKTSRYWHVIQGDLAYETATGQPEGTVHIYGGKMKAGPPGSVHLLEVGGNANSVIPPGEYLGMWGDKDWCAKQALEDRAFRQAVAAQKREKDEKRDDPFLQVLQPLQDLYTRCSPGARAQMLMRVVYELQRGIR